MRDVLRAAIALHWIVVHEVLQLNDGGKGSQVLATASVKRWDETLIPHSGVVYMLRYTDFEGDAGALRQDPAPG